MTKVSLFAIVMSLAIGCGGKKPPPPPPPAPEPVKEVKKEEPPPPPPPPPPKHAMATMAGTKKYAKVKGTVEFKEVDGGVEVTANLEGLKKGDHGFHVHEKGDCSAPDGNSAGGHFNPSGHKHGAPDAEEHHEGDFGNITADKDGKATKTFTISFVNLKDGDPNSIVGKGFIIHAKADDLKTQPTGNAGDRVACGVITADDAGAAKSE
ncbi:MAG: superoxide dismutase family protein [Kofleriaceae bacterium]